LAELGRRVAAYAERAPSPQGSWLFDTCDHIGLPISNKPTDARMHFCLRLISPSWECRCTAMSGRRQPIARAGELAAA